jgi:hypothetical protein
VALATTVLVGGGVGTAAYTKTRSHGSNESQSVADTTTAGPSASSTTSAASSSGVSHAVAAKVSTEPAVDWDKALSDALDNVTGGADARYSVAILDTKSGKSAVHGDGSYDTASIVKVDILASLLLQAQDDNRHLTTQENAYAKVMIQNSDNTAATALWKSIGYADGLEAANKRLGLTETAGGSGVLWGLTQTTAADQLKLLKAVFGGSSVLSNASQAYIQTLMGQVETDQDWGVPSAATGDYAVKNGWLQRTTTLLWDINSIGRVTADGHTYLVAVVSKGSTTQAKGIALVEEAAQAAVKGFTKTAEEATS